MPAGWADRSGDRSWPIRRAHAGDGGRDSCLAAIERSPPTGDMPAGVHAEYSPRAATHPQGRADSDYRGFSDSQPRIQFRMRKILRMDHAISHDHIDQRVRRQLRGSQPQSSVSICQRPRPTAFPFRIAAKNQNVGVLRHGKHDYTMQTGSSMLATGICTAILQAARHRTCSRSMG